MATSQNGWSTITSAQLDRTTFSVPGVRKGDVAVIMKYIEREFDKRVQKLYNPGCWGWATPTPIPGTNVISNHGSGTAIDLNAPSFPWKLDRMTTKQKSECRKIVAELEGAVRWGGDYASNNLDQMHFEISASAAKVKQVANKLKEKTMTTTEVNVLFRFYLGQAPSSTQVTTYKKLTFAQGQKKLVESRTYTTRKAQSKSGTLKAQNHLPVELRTVYKPPASVDVTSNDEEVRQGMLSKITSLFKK